MAFLPLIFFPYYSANAKCCFHWNAWHYCCSCLPFLLKAGQTFFYGWIHTCYLKCFSSLSLLLVCMLKNRKTSMCESLWLLPLITGGWFRFPRKDFRIIWNPFRKVDLQSHFNSLPAFYISDLGLNCAWTAKSFYAGGYKLAKMWWF